MGKFGDPRLHRNQFTCGHNGGYGIERRSISPDDTYNEAFPVLFEAMGERYK